MALTDYLMGGQSNNLPPVLNRQNGTAQAMSSLDQVLSSGSPYIENARRRGLETAAARGGINSSIAAGASERAAIEGAMPLVQQGLQIDAARQNAQYENWLSEQNFGRALVGQKFNNSSSMLQTIQEYALADPELYTPDAVSGLTNFFSQNANGVFDSILARYFGRG
jgi:hypothetical protein